MLENKIKELILNNYGSLSYFCKKINIPCSTLDSILKRGIGKANVINVIKICNELGISVDSLKQGIIQPVGKTDRLNKKKFANEVKFLLEQTSSLTDQEKKHLLSTLDFICSDDK